MYERGAVWSATLPEIGRKPVVLVSAAVVTQRLRPIVARITSVERSRSLPSVVPLEAGEVDGLSEPSFVLCHDLSTLAQGGLVDSLGSLPAPRMLEVERALLFSLGMG